MPTGVNRLQNPLVFLFRTVSQETNGETSRTSFLTAFPTHEAH